MADHLRDATKKVDFILREDAVQCAEDIADDLFDSASEGARIVAKWLKDIPTADVVEVVRCRDCLHYTDHDCPISWGKTDDDFCSFGERRDEDGV